MPKKGLTEIIVVLDRSGSMQSMKTDAIGGFNAFIEKQKKQPGEARVTIALFDHEYQLLYNGVDINKLEPLNDTTYVPRGSTALLDAIGRTINDVEARIKKAPKKERPENVIAIVITDGQENASHEFRRDSINEILKTQREKHKWEILFIGADEASMQDASAMGLGMTRGASGQSVSAVYTMGNVNPRSFSRGIGGQSAGGDYHSALGSQPVMMAAYDAIGTAVSNYRSTGTVGDWTKGEDLTKDKAEV